MSEHPTERTNTLQDKNTDINVQRYDNYLSTSKRDDIVTTGQSKTFEPHVPYTNCS